MPKNVVCKKCNNLVNDWCEKVIDSPDPDMQRDCQHFREKTNADRIRDMSDEELAEFLFQVGYNHRWCLKEYAIEWLQQTAGEEDKHEQTD